MAYVVFSYDDGTIYDIKMVLLMNKYHIKGTFNLNTNLDGYVWYNNDIAIKRPTLRDMVSLYEGHEVACHSATHPRLDTCDDGKLYHEIYESKEVLKELFGIDNMGFATPFDTYSEHAIDYIKEASYLYCRLPILDNDYKHNDLFHLSINALTYEGNVLEKLKEFESVAEDDDIFIIAGHSYEYFLDDSWDELEKLFKYIKKSKILKSATLKEALKLGE